MTDEQAVVPTREHIRTLPRWARIALAARCAQRTTYVMDEGGDATKQEKKAVERAIALTELLAIDAGAFNSLDALSSAGQEANDASKAIRERCADFVAAIVGKAGAGVDMSPYSNGALRAATGAAMAGSAAAAAVAALNYEDDIPFVADVIDAAIRIANIGNSEAEKQFVANGMIRDYRTLLELAMRDNWNNDSIVPLRVFEPINADGASHVKPLGPPRIMIAWDPEVLSEEDYVRLIKLLGDLVRAEGGAGLQRFFSQGYSVPVEEGVLV